MLKIYFNGRNICYSYVPYPEYATDANHNYNCAKNSMKSNMCLIVFNIC